MTAIEIIKPKTFEKQSHFYPKVCNAQLHPLVQFFVNLPVERMINRYCHLKPSVNAQSLEKLIFLKPKNLLWAGIDLFHVTTHQGKRKMVLVETNTCPSGQKSMPQELGADGRTSYNKILEALVSPLVQSPQDHAAILYDKNYMEVSGYAAALANILNRDVFLVPFFDQDPNLSSYARFVEGRLEIKIENSWIPIQVAWRYVTQKPWNRIPIQTKTKILNPIVCCLAGGRNKMLAAKAYQLFNAELAGSGLKILTPETISDVSKDEIPFWVKKFGGKAVVKVPYSNAGQGVYTITSKRELDAFMEETHGYNQFIIQSLIGNSTWSSRLGKGFYHVGTVPDSNNKLYAADLRIMGCPIPNQGIKPIAIYGRRAQLPLSKSLRGDENSWDMLGTNLSVKRGDNSWGSDSSRLIAMDLDDFNSLGLGLDELIEGYIQFVLAMNAIDRMSSNLLQDDGTLNLKLFQSFNNDTPLVKEIYP